MTPLVLLLGCSISNFATEPWEAPVPTDPMLSEVLANPTPLEVDVIVSATWSVPLSGLLDLTRPETAHLTDQDTPIDLPIVRIRHPEHGAVFIDTGVDRDIASGGSGAVRGLVKGFLKGMEPQVSLGALMAEEDSVHSVLLTHVHVDHVLGLPDVPAEVPLLIGPNDLDTRDWQHAFVRGTYGALLQGRDAVQEFDRSRGVSLGGIDGAIDLFGDGALWAIPASGHTLGSTVYFVNAPSPWLILGDASHTCWGWENSVPPGTFSHDLAGAEETFHTLKKWAGQIPDLQVVAGHVDCDVSLDSP